MLDSLRSRCRFTSIWDARWRLSPAAKKQRQGSLARCIAPDAGISSTMQAFVRFLANHTREPATSIGFMRQYGHGRCHLYIFFMCRFLSFQRIKGSGADRIELSRFVPSKAPGARDVVPSSCCCGGGVYQTTAQTDSASRHLLLRISTPSRRKRVPRRTGPHREAPFCLPEAGLLW